MDRIIPTKKEAQKWANALRSKKFIQGTGMLESKVERFCCLGVACKVFIPVESQTFSKGRLEGCYPEDQRKAPKWLKLVNDDIEKKLEWPLSYLNDMRDYSFDEIADIIELVYVHKAI